MIIKIWEGEVPMYCTKCGQQIPDDSQFCSFCGAKVRTGDISHSQQYTVNNNGKFDNSFYHKEEVLSKSGLFSFKGRRNRLPYFMTAWVLNMIINFFAKIMVSGRLSSSMELGLFAALLFLAYIVATNISKRLQDMNINGYLSIPLVILTNSVYFLKEFGVVLIGASIVCNLFLAFKRGTVGDNDYGADPLKE